jgi:hypothetical protein
MYYILKVNSISSPLNHKRTVEEWFCEEDVDENWDHLKLIWNESNSISNKNRLDNICLKDKINREASVRANELINDNIDNRLKYSVNDDDDEDNNNNNNNNNKRILNNKKGIEKKRRKVISYNESESEFEEEDVRNSYIYIYIYIYNIHQLIISVKLLFIGL